MVKNIITLNQDQEQALNILTDWYFDKTKGQELACLEGYAGTGKTFLSKYFIKELGIKNVLVSAPTNKAKTVIQEMTGYDGKTIHSILGLAMDMDLANFDPNKPQFNPKRERDLNYKLILIDEASMINVKLYKELKEAAASRGVKMLFMGDRYQIPPVGESISSVFIDCPVKAKLNKVVRQGEDNPNSRLIELCIQDIHNRTNTVNPYILKHSQDIKADDLGKSKGFVNLNEYGRSSFDYFASESHNFLDNKSKYLAYTNSNIEETIGNMRSKIFKLEDYITKVDSLVGYKTVSTKRGRLMTNIITNSEEYSILNFDKVMLTDGMQGFQVMLENLFTGSVSYVNIVDLSDEKTRQIYTQTTNELYMRAKSLGRVHWKNYFTFVHSALALETIYKPDGTLLKKKELDFMYGYTVHKSQGSTFENTFVNITNIDKHFKKDEVARLKYVALSRCKNVNIIM